VEWRCVRSASLSCLFHVPQSNNKNAVHVSNMKDGG